MVRISLIVAIVFFVGHIELACVGFVPSNCFTLDLMG